MRVRHHKIAKAGLISPAARADIAVLLGIVPPPAYVEGEETVEIDLTEAAEEKENLAHAAKEDLFETVNTYGPLPKKTFSMGHAEEKRF